MFITIENLVKEYNLKEGKSLKAVNNVNLSIDKGDIYGIMGLSGAGKSTLIRLINRLEEPTSGKIIVRWENKEKEEQRELNEENVLSYNQNELRDFRKKTGMIFQHFNLLNSRSVKGNVAFPLEISGWKKDEIDKRVDELLEIVGLSDKRENYPEQLSGGQKQRVAIARALANNPEILLSDEATSALDPRTTNSILELLKDINRRFGITIILITHQMEVIRKICNKAAIMSDGEIVEEGTTKNIFLHPKTQLAKEFVENISHESFEEEEKEKIEPKGRKKLKLKFTEEQVDKPYISEIIKRYNAEINILGGSIDKLTDSVIGHLTVEIKAEEDQIRTITKWLEMNNVEMEAL